MAAPKGKAVKNYYESEATDYNQAFYEEESPYPTLQYRHNYIVDMVEDCNFGDKIKVLDIGCGPGPMIIDLMRHEWELWGIDIAENMIEIARQRVLKSKKKNQVHLSVGDIENLDFEDEFFDLIIVSGVVEYLPGDEKWSAELDRVMKPGGVLIVNVTNRWAIRRWTAPLIEPLKRSKFIYNIGNFIKQKILRRGKLHHFPFRPRVHSPRKFDAFLADLGFKKLRHNYFDFSIFVAPFDTLLGFITIPIRKWMERFSRKKMVLFGMGYIVSARKS